MSKITLVREIKIYSGTNNVQKSQCFLSNPILQTIQIRKKIWVLMSKIYQ